MKTIVSVLIAIIASLSSVSCERTQHAGNEAKEEIRHQSEKIADKSSAKAEALGEEMKHAANKASEEVRHEAAKK